MVPEGRCATVSYRLVIAYYFIMRLTNWFMHICRIKAEDVPMWNAGVFCCIFSIAMFSYFELAGVLTIVHQRTLWYWCNHLFPHPTSSWILGNSSPILHFASRLCNDLLLSLDISRFCASSHVIMSPLQFILACELLLQCDSIALAEHMCTLIQFLMVASSSIFLVSFQLTQ